MNIKIKRQWLKALRSKRFKQTQGGLRNEEGYCCLGVLCHIMGANPRADKNKWHNKGEAEGTGYPSKDILLRAGLKKSNATYLARLNDNDKSFESIADIIERRY